MKKLLLLLLFTAILSANWNLYPTYPKYLKKRAAIVKNFYFRANTSEKIVALTFDDGPNRYTPKIINVLKKYNAPATYFLMAKNLNYKYDYLYSNPLFSVGMHTYSHKRFDRMNLKQIDNDFRKAIYLFKKHKLPYNLFRPSYGSVNSRLVAVTKKYNIKPILWSNDTRDWSKKLRSYKIAINSLTNGDIILMHDHATSPRNLERLILAIKAKGFSIVPLNYLTQYPSTFPIK